MQFEQLEHELSEERSRFTVKVEQEHAKLRAEVAAGSAGWRKEAENLARQLAQVRAQVAQTSEAVIWAGKELGGIQEELAVRQQAPPQVSKPSQPPPEALARVQQARADLQAAAQAFETRCTSMDCRIEEMRELLDGSLRDFGDRMDELRVGLAQTNDLFSQAVSTVSGDIASLSQLQRHGGALEKGAAAAASFDSVEALGEVSPLSLARVLAQARSGGGGAAPAQALGAAACAVTPECPGIGGAYRGMGWRHATPGGSDPERSCGDGPAPNGVGVSQTRGQLHALHKRGALTAPNATT